MRYKVGLVIRNKSYSLLLVKPIRNKKERELGIYYTFPTLLVDEEESRDQALRRLMDVLIVHQNPSLKELLSYESDDYEVDYFFVEGDFDISKAFYEHFESFKYLHYQDFDSKNMADQDIDEDALFIMDAIRDIVIENL
ncbi:hypothetical protein D6810_00285 [Candidatus Dojkabacteria bacterium]|uniref:Uncharacterized protein n=1 Tax=Candidatus Dojkabacteria bacterium TaxID=2099670 RepID=A0A3M0YZW8_9BACT|nr:MAG: hypothetical protein D6810_00285 [Candidatus Dojkabacteria bacterium]